MNNNENETKGKFYLRYIDAGGVLMAVITDEEVLGMKAEDPQSGIRIIVSESFYKGELVDLDKIIEAMEKADMIILTGNRCIETAIKLGFVNPDSVLKVDNLSQAQVMKFGY